MAPVGSRESLTAAIQAGADSVYFGVEQLNMRSHSANHFTIDDLREIAQTCREHGMKSYLTVNTIIYDEDLPLMRQIIDAAREAQITAIIASDVAVMQYCLSSQKSEVRSEKSESRSEKSEVRSEKFYNHCPDEASADKGNKTSHLSPLTSHFTSVHLSTQLNISNVEALRFYAQFADVVVLARELKIEQVEAIHRAIVEEHICGPSGELVRIEMFCHGALCMAVSGKCYMSLDQANRSANRGECIQVCRRSYTATDNETGYQLEIDNKYIMSPKDLKTVRFIDRLMRAGVSVFKIEGQSESVLQF